MPQTASNENLRQNPLETCLAKHTTHHAQVSAPPPTLGGDDTPRARHADCADADVEIASRPIVDKMPRNARFMKTSID